MHAIKLIKDGEVIGYRADTMSVSIVDEIDHAKLFDSDHDACQQIINDVRSADYLPYDDFEVVVL